jgi:hypothetical protein
MASSVAQMLAVWNLTQDFVEKLCLMNKLYTIQLISNLPGSISEVTVCYQYEKLVGVLAKQTCTEIERITHEAVDVAVGFKASELGSSLTVELYMDRIPLLGEGLSAMLAALQGMLWAEFGCTIESVTKQLINGVVWKIRSNQPIHINVVACMTESTWSGIQADKQVLWVTAVVKVVQQCLRQLKERHGTLFQASKEYKVRIQ